ncbi:unnamed protein product [Caenorhabditis sp. 36 PRJEB53466]|nr:unnamed protein product [Caenorhabditis sp. 36 PRJEB53466]
MHFLLAVFLLLGLVPPVFLYCAQCGGFQKRYNFNFEQFFKNVNFGALASGSSNGAGGNVQFSSYGVPRQQQRILNMYGQDAEAFGSAIGKSIGQRIQQAYAQQQEPTTAYDIEFTAPSSSSSASPSTLQTAPPTSSGSVSTSRHSTHPPEDLPTVQQAFQQGTHGFGHSSAAPVLTFSSGPKGANSFGGLPGMLPPRGAQSEDCPWCGLSEAWRAKRKESEEKSST